jgi:hypothetical protein
MTEFVRFTLDDGSEVIFEPAESDLVALRMGSRRCVRVAGLPRGCRVAEAAEEVPGSLRSRLDPDEESLEFGLKVYAEVNWWFFTKSGIPGCRLDAAAAFIEIDFTPFREDDGHQLLTRRFWHQGGIPHGARQCVALSRQP